MIFFTNSLFCLKKTIKYVSFIGVLLFFYSPILRAQNKESVKNLSYQLAKIDTLIEKKDFKGAEIILSQLKSNSIYSDKNYQLKIDIKEAELLYFKVKHEKAL